MKSFLTSFMILLLSLTSAYSQQKNFDYDKTVNFCISQLTKSIEEVSDSGYPIRTQGMGQWELTEPQRWTSGFFGGCLWYANLIKPNETLLNGAIKYTESLEEQKYNKGTHDIGFMMFNSFGNGLKLGGKNEYKDIILESARSLASRFNPKVGCIQSWNGDFQVIIDNMMNLELLFWASKNNIDKSFYDIAVTHANTTMKNHLCEDGSSFHVVVYDTATGEILKRKTAQGLADNSAWARGQAWGIYGFTLCHRETQDEKYLETAIKMADYFIDHLAEDYIPYWDLLLPKDSPKQYRDASAAAIAVSALLDLRNYIDDHAKYDETIHNMLAALANNYLAEGSGSSGLIIHSAYNVNSQNPFDWDASTIWGDYYFLESLIRYKEAGMDK